MNKECRFCKGGLGISKELNTTIGDAGVDTGIIDLTGNHLEFNVTKYNALDIYEGNIKINYCPKCGRYLG